MLSIGDGYLTNLKLIVWNLLLNLISIYVQCKNTARVFNLIVENVSVCSRVYV